MARGHFLENRIPPPLWAALFAGGMWLLHRTAPLAVIVPRAWRWTGIVLALLGFALDVWCIRFFRRAHTTVNPLAPQRSSALVTGGPFALSRNPMYVGMLLWLTGWAVYLGSLSPFLTVPVFVLVLTRLQIIPEERALRQIFGDAFAAYCRRVPRWLGLVRKAS